MLLTPSPLGLALETLSTLELELKIRLPRATNRAKKKEKL